MTGQDLIEWREKEGLSQLSASKALGWSRSALIGAEKKPAAPIPRYIALACAAVTFGLPPYR